MPATLMWARGLEERAVSIRFEPPAGTSWRVATQLLPGADPLTYRADTLQYLMDSPAEVSAFALRTFTIGSGPRAPIFRLAIHHDGTGAELDAFVADVERIVRAEREVFGEYPAYEGNTYTFIADYLPWATGDAMEHRNSTVLTSPSSIRGTRLDLLDTIAHEFFHGWNMERIRPASLEPFDFDRANMSGELWLGEGFTNYYGPLSLRRAGLTTTAAFVADVGNAIDTVTSSPGRQWRSAREMSELAPFVDAATSIDRTSFDNTFISYYTWGSVIGLGLDLTLRERSDGRITLDHFMRALWQTHGKPGGRTQGTVDRPYTNDDVKTALAAVSGDAAFARDFFARYIEGREVVDFARLLGLAGVILRPVAPGQATAGAFRLQDGPTGPRVMSAVPFGSPAYDAGLDREDIVLSLGGARITSAASWTQQLQRRKPGDEIPIEFRRRGEMVAASIRLAEDTRLRAVPAEDLGVALTAAQRAFRDAWLGAIP
jgi:predicted metalloprotease with PDZ domain